AIAGLGPASYLGIGVYEHGARDAAGFHVWGYNYNGELCLGVAGATAGTVLPQTVPTPHDVTPELADASEFAGGWRHGCFLVDGFVKCCGWDFYGQIGLPNADQD